jgi:nicotinamidase-related amidase
LGGSSSNFHTWARRAFRNLISFHEVDKRELGYEVMVVKDAISDYSDEEMHAALDVNIPNYASAIVTTD